MTRSPWREKEQEPLSCGITPIGDCAIVHAPKSATTVHSKSSVPRESRDAAFVGVCMRTNWTGSEVTMRPKPTRMPGELCGSPRLLRASRRQYHQWCVVRWPASSCRRPLSGAGERARLLPWFAHAAASLGQIVLDLVCLHPCLTPRVPNYRITMRSAGRPSRTIVQLEGAPLCEIRAGEE